MSSDDDVGEERRSRLSDVVHMVMMGNDVDASK